MEEVLSEYRERFISDVDVNMVVMELLDKSIISDGVQESIAKADGPTQRSEILHACLKRTCTKEAFGRVCSIIASVRGNPKMSALGEEMQSRLESGACVCVCVRACVRLCVHLPVHMCVHLCVHMVLGSISLCCLLIIVDDA